MSYYVYVVSVDGIDRYVGRGKGQRYQHGISGASSCKELNRDYYSGCNLLVSILIGNLTKEESIVQEALVIQFYDISQLYNKQVPKVTYLAEINKLTLEDLIGILHYWSKDNLGVFTNAILSRYNDNINNLIESSERWVDYVSNSKGYQQIFIDAVKQTDHYNMELVKNCPFYNEYLLRVGSSISKRAGTLKRIHKLQLLLIEKDSRIKELESDLNKALELKTWEDQARFMLQKGYTQKEVADRLGKGIATIGRLVKKIKDEL